LQINLLSFIVANTAPYTKGLTGRREVDAVTHHDEIYDAAVLPAPKAMVFSGSEIHEE
jgi:hypothetical protein